MPSSDQPFVMESDASLKLSRYTDGPFKPVLQSIRCVAVKDTHLRPNTEFIHMACHLIKHDISDLSMGPALGTLIAQFGCINIGMFWHDSIRNCT